MGDGMQEVKITELRQHLPEYLRRVASGDEIAVTVRGKVVARLVPEPQRRVPGSARGQVTMAEDFDAPMDELGDWV